MNSPLIAILYAFLIMLGGWWLASLHGWFNWGLALMALALYALIKGLIGFLAQSFHSARQINLLHESRTLSYEYGQARLATTEDDFIKNLSKNIEGFLHWHPWQVTAVL